MPDKSLIPLPGQTSFPFMAEPGHSDPQVPEQGGSASGRRSEAPRNPTNQAHPLVARTRRKRR